MSKNVIINEGGAAVVNHAREELLEFVNRLCSENSLQYFAFADLLVGAVHYENFLPGNVEKNIEIGLLREDYNKLYHLSVANAEAAGITVDDRFPGGAHRLTFILKKTTVIENSDCTICIDANLRISAFDYVPDSPAQQKVYFRKIFRIRKKYARVSNPGAGMSAKSSNLKKIVSVILNAIAYHTQDADKVLMKVLRLATECPKSGYIRRLVPEYGVLLPVEDVFPTVKRKVGNVEITCPNNVYHWTALMDEELEERTKTIQKIDLVILKEFDRVCREIGVGYFVCGGTMLGLMRHGGFIPWDDDADVGMLRADYDKFLREAPKYLSEDFFLQTRQSDPKIPYLFSKIRMNETEYITNYNELRDFHKGICLDLFPFDYLPEDPRESSRFKAEVLRASHIHNLVINKHIEKPVYESPADSSRERWARFINEVRRLIVHIVPLKLTQWNYIRRATRYNKVAAKEGLTTVASFVPTYTYAAVSDMKPYQDVNFEGIRTMALKDPDKFLTMQYGDYMQLPAMHQRVGHDLIRWGISDKMAAKYHIYDGSEASD